MKLKIISFIMSIAMISSLTNNVFAESTVASTSNNQFIAINNYNVLLDHFQQIPYLKMCSGLSKEVYPDNYGGAYYGADDKLHILTTDILQFDYYRVLTDSENITFEIVENSYNELIEAKNFIYEYMKPLGIIMSTLYEHRNIIELQVKNKESIDNISTFITNNGYDLSLFSFTVNNEYPQASEMELETPIYANARSTNKATPGSKLNIQRPSGNYYATVGFNARNSSGYGLVTAAHCSWGNATFSNDSFQSLGSSGVTVSTQYDVMFIPLPSNFGTSATISGTPYTSTYVIGGASTRVLELSTIVYSFGQKTGMQSGQVLSSSSDVTYTNEYNNNELITYRDNYHISNYSGGGNSGGPVCTYDSTTGKYTLVGIISGSAGNDDSFSYCIAAKLGNATSSLGLLSITAQP